MPAPTEPPTERLLLSPFEMKGTLSTAVDAKRRVQILERRGAGIDHSVLMRLRETRYLRPMRRWTRCRAGSSR